MSTKLTYTGAEVQELLDKIEKGDFDNAKTLEGHPASYFAIASEFTSLAESFATEQGRINTLYSYFNNGSANDALRLGGQLPSYYATATQYEILQQTLTDFKSLFDSMFEKDSGGNIHAKLSLWSSGGITAGGVGSGGSGGGGVSYDRLDAWADYSADKSGWVLSALLGKDLDDRVSALANAGYITQSALAPYALRSEIPSLVGYATESFVTSQGYITASALGGYATQSWVGENYLSKSGGTLTDALTVKGSGSPLTVHRTQPLASVVKFVNTDGNLGWLGVDIDKTAIFMEASGVINKLLHSGNYADYITNSYLKSTLGISDWALASTKPTYTASEVGALAQDSSGANADLDTILDSKTAVLKPFFQVLTNNNVGSARKGVLRMSYNGSESQLLFDHYNRLLRYRTIGEKPIDWATIAFTSDIPTKLSDLTDDVVVGKYLPLSGGKLVYSGAQGIEAERTDGAPSHIMFIGLVNGTSRQLGGFGMNGYNDPVYVNPNGIRHKVLTAENYSDYALSKNGGIVNGSITATSFIGNLTGNADSATKLQTPRSIWGQSFDGTGDISGSLNFRNGSSITCANGIVLEMYAGVDTYLRGSSNIYISAPNVYTQRNVYTYKVLDFGNYSNLLAGGTINGSLTATSFIGNSLTIGGATITYDSVNKALCINGNMYALGGITAGAAGISAYTSLEARVARLEQQLNIS